MECLQSSLTLGPFLFPPLLRKAIPRPSFKPPHRPENLPACRISLNQLSARPIFSLLSSPSFPTASPSCFTYASSHCFQDFHLSQSHPLKTRTRPLSEINSQLVLSFSRFDPVPFYSSGDYKSQDAQLPCGPLGNKEPSLRGRGAVHRLSDAKPWKSGLS